MAMASMTGNLVVGGLGVSSNSVVAQSTDGWLAGWLAD